MTWQRIFVLAGVLTMLLIADCSGERAGPAPNPDSSQAAAAPAEDDCRRPRAQNDIAPASYVSASIASLLTFSGSAESLICIFRPKPAVVSGTSWFLRRSLTTGVGEISFNYGLYSTITRSCVTGMGTGARPRAWCGRNGTTTTVLISCAGSSATAPPRLT